MGLSHLEPHILFSKHVFFHIYYASNVSWGEVVRLFCIMGPFKHLESICLYFIYMLNKVLYDATFRRRVGLSGGTTAQRKLICIVILLLLSSRGQLNSLCTVLSALAVRGKQKDCPLCFYSHGWRLSRRLLSQIILNKKATRGESFQLPSLSAPFTSIVALSQVLSPEQGCYKNG